MPGFDEGMRMVLEALVASRIRAGSPIRFPLISSPLIRRGFTQREINTAIDVFVRERRVAYAKGGRVRLLATRH